VPDWREVEDSVNFPGNIEIPWNIGYAIVAVSRTLALNAASQRRFI
jgi:hypothetical protein